MNRKEALDLRKTLLFTSVSTSTNGTSYLTVKAITNEDGSFNLHVLDVKQSNHTHYKDVAKEIVKDAEEQGVEQIILNGVGIGNGLYQYLVFTSENSKMNVFDVKSLSSLIGDLEIKQCIEKGRIKFLKDDDDSIGYDVNEALKSAFLYFDYCQS